MRSLKPFSVAPGAEVGADDEACIILAGWCARRVGGAHDPQGVAVLLLPGDLIGLEAPRWAADDFPVVALSPVIVARAGDLKKAMGESPVKHRRLRDACEEAVRFEQRMYLGTIFRLGNQAGHERVAHLLVELRARLGQVGLLVDDSFHLPVSQDMLAQTLGISVVHLGRILRQMRRDGVIRLDGGHLRILDAHKLAALSGSAPPPA